MGTAIEVTELSVEIVSTSALRSPSIHATLVTAREPLLVGVHTFVWISLCGYIDLPNAEPCPSAERPIPIGRILLDKLNQISVTIVASKKVSVRLDIPVIGAVI